MLGVCRYFRVPAAVCINKFDINEETSRRIDDYCDNEGIPLAGRLPYDDSVSEAMACGVPLVRYRHDGLVLEIEKLWERVAGELCAGRGETVCRS